MYTYEYRHINTDSLGNSPMSLWLSHCILYLITFLPEALPLIFSCLKDKVHTFWYRLKESPQHTGKQYTEQLSKWALELWLHPLLAVWSWRSNFSMAQPLHSSNGDFNNVLMKHLRLLNYIWCLSHLAE